MAKTSNGKKRQSPSVERQLALALIRLIECAGMLDEGASARTDLAQAVAEAIPILDSTGYKDLESIATRVKRIQVEIAKAVEANDGAALTQLGAALDRAKKGLPPLATEKKPRAPRKAKTPKSVSTAATVTKPRKKKGDTKPSPEGEGTPCQCLYLGCGWTGVAVVDSACPVCNSAVVADESGAK